MNQDKWWNRALAMSIVFHIGLLVWVAWVDPFAPKPAPPESYLDLELVNVKDLPPIPSGSASKADMANAQAIPKLKPHAPTAPKPIMPMQKIVSPEEATETAPVASPSSYDSSSSSSTAVQGGGSGEADGSGTGSGEGTSTGSGSGDGGTTDLSCGPVVVSRGTAKCKTPLRRPIEVYVQIAIGTDGAVHSASVASSSGNSGADQAALEAAYSYTFRPAQDRYGNPIASGGQIKVTVQPNR